MSCMLSALTIPFNNCACMAAGMINSPNRAVKSFFLFIFSLLKFYFITQWGENSIKGKATFLRKSAIIVYFPSLFLVFLDDFHYICIR